jgi:hypothetical protein
MFNINPNTKNISFRDEVFTFEIKDTYLMLTKKIKLNNCEEVTNNIITDIDNIIKMRLDDINYLKQKIIETIDENYELEAKVDINYYIDLINNHKTELNKIYNKKTFEITFDIKKTITKWKCLNNVRITLMSGIYLVWMPLIINKMQSDKPIVNVYESKKTINKILEIKV